MRDEEWAEHEIKWRELIRRHTERELAKRELPFTIEDRHSLLWVAVDLDGTLCESVWPQPGIGAPIERNIKKLRRLEEHGYKIIIHTSRSWEFYELIESWLIEHEIPFSRIVCGKLLAKIYIDDRALNSEAESWVPVPEEIE